MRAGKQPRKIEESGIGHLPIGLRHLGFYVGNTSYTIVGIHGLTAEWTGGLKMRTIAVESTMMIRELLAQVEPPFTGEELFDHLSNVVFFIKNTCGEYLVVNQTLVDRCGLREKRQVLGRTAGAVLKAPLGARFEAQDRRILETGEPLISQLELHVYPSRDVGWCLTTKLPLRNRRGDVLGLVGVSQDLRLPDVETKEYQHLSSAIEHARSRLASGPSVSELAAVARMSRYQLDRRMRRVFGLTTGQWLLTLRIDTARWMLRDTDVSIASIALDVGYSDQSAFTRQFRRTTGLSPRCYRQNRGSEADRASKEDRPARG